MKVLLLGLLLVGAYAAEWDLADVSSNNDWTKAAASVGGSNQGYKARYTSQGKLLKLSLAVHKEKNVRVTDTDRLLFGMEAPQSHIRKMENVTVSRVDSEELCKRALGDKWAEMVTLPEEDLTYIESLRLAASLNEYNLLKAGSSIRKNTRSNYGYHESESHEASFPSDFDCICHSTSHRFPWSPVGADAHDTPFWGIRLLQRYTRHTDPGHSVHGIPNCILCDHTQIGNPADEANGFDFDCRWCCSGECVIGTGGETIDVGGVGGAWFDCDTNFAFDSFRVADPTMDITFNYFRINDVGTCRLPRVYDCVTEVNRWCENCANFLQEIVPDSDSDSDFLEELEACSYCDLVVGANPFICNNCSHALQNIQDFEASFRGATPEGCSCENAMFQVSQNERYHEGDNHHEDSYEHEEGHYESYDYRGYDYRGYESHEGDHHEGDHYESHDYRPSDYNYDYRGYESHEGDHYEGDHYESHDYRPSDYDYRPRDYDYRPSDYDYRPRDYDYRPADYNYDYRGYDYREGDHYEGDHYESHDYRPSDYDYRPRDYDYRGDGYESHDYRPSDYDYRPRDYDYRGYDYDYRG